MLPDIAIVISLPRSRERLAAALEHLRAVRIEPSVFYGFDGKQSGLFTAYQFVKNVPRGEPLGPITTSLAVSHMALWRACLLLPLDTFLILEDDVRFDADWRPVLSSAEPYLPPSWDLLFLGSCCTVTRARLADRLYALTTAMCMHAYVVHRRALSFLIEACEQVSAPIDIALADRALPRLQSFVIYPNIARQHNTEYPP